MSWLADAVVLAAAFELAGLAIPWRRLLFAYAASKMGGGLVPLPGGLGGVEGGLLGALALADAPMSAAAMPRAMLPAPMMVCMVNILTAVPEDPRPTQPVRPLPGCVGRSC